MEQERLIDITRLPRVPMKRIILHWTAGWHDPRPDELTHYHFVISGDCEVKWGVSIALNARPLRRGSRYAAHTLNFNESSIGVSVASMVGSKELPAGCVPGPAPFTKDQWDTLVQVVSELAEFYKIPITHRTIFSHAEATALGVKQRGKWDFTRLPFNGSLLGARRIGDQFRNEVLAFRNQKKSVTASVLELADTKTAEVTGVGVPFAASDVVETKGNELVNSIPPATDALSQLRDVQNEVFTIYAYGVQWAGVALKYIAYAIAIALAVKYGLRLWRSWFPPKPNEFERARGVD